MAEEITYELFTRRFEQLNEMHRELRADIRSLGDSILQLSRQVSNLDRRVSDVKEELEGTIKMEVGGAMAHLETRLEHLIERRLGETQSQFNED